ncbi:hypothetical protein KC326_g69 [Hortaea werneckii]|nr:hypothetical protein KC326_g69 [Hortaea werneckii]
MLARSDTFLGRSAAVGDFSVPDMEGLEKGWKPGESESVGIVCGPTRLARKSRESRSELGRLINRRYFFPTALASLPPLLFTAKTRSELRYCGVN